MIMNLIDSVKRLSLFEVLLWAVSAVSIAVSGFIGAFDFMSLAASLIGVTALIFIAKGDVLGQILTIVFSLL